MGTDFRSHRGGLGVLLALLVAFGLPCSVADETQDPADTVVVFVVRHTEKAKDGSKDPDLTEAGRHRAEELASLLGQSGITHLYSSEFRRTRETVGPLARATGIEVQVVPAEEAERQVRLLRDLPAGSVAVVVGHSNTVPGLVRALGGDLAGTLQTEYGEMIGDHQYDRLFQVVLPAPGEERQGEPAQTLELRYGEASPRS